MPAHAPSGPYSRPSRASPSSNSQHADSTSLAASNLESQSPTPSWDDEMLGPEQLGLSPIRTTVRMLQPPRHLAPGGWPLQNSSRQMRWALLATCLLSLLLVASLVMSSRRARQGQLVNLMAPRVTPHGQAASGNQQDKSADSPPHPGSATSLHDQLGYPATLASTPGSAANSLPTAITSPAPPQVTLAAEPGSSTGNSGQHIPVADEHTPGPGEHLDTSINAGQGMSVDIHSTSLAQDTDVTAAEAIQQEMPTELAVGHRLIDGSEHDLLLDAKLSHDGKLAQPATGELTAPGSQTQQTHSTRGHPSPTSSTGLQSQSESSGAGSSIAALAGSRTENAALSSPHTVPEEVLLVSSLLQHQEDVHKPELTDTASTPHEPSHTLQQASKAGTEQLPQAALRPQPVAQDQQPVGTSTQVAPVAQATTAVPPASASQVGEHSTAAAAAPGEQRLTTEDLSGPGPPMQHSQKSEEADEALQQLQLLAGAEQARHDTPQADHSKVLDTSTARDGHITSLQQNSKQTQMPVIVFKEDSVSATPQPVMQAHKDTLHEGKASDNMLEHISGPRPQSGVEVSGSRIEPAPVKYPLWWFGPFYSGTGYSSEANNFVLSMYRSGQLHARDLWIEHHGDEYRENVVKSMDPADRRDLAALQQFRDKQRPAIVLCHSLPTNWNFPIGQNQITGGQCPPDPRVQPYVYLVGRTMFETDKLPAGFVPRCNAMNEVWVPSEFSRDVFIRSGVDPRKLVVVPEGVNTTWFDPDKYEPIPLPEGDLVFGHDALADGAATGGEAQSMNHSAGLTSSKQQTFRFLSAFKWEPRKGWDVLLEAYLREFTAEDDVEMYILTKPFVGGTNFKFYMQNWARRTFRKLGNSTVNMTAFPRLYVIHTHISDSNFPRYYKAVDAFVLPSRGEGWGRPHVEAMSMGLPIIATNWSGITAYLDESVGYPIEVEKLITVNDNSVWWFKGLQWAQPSVAHLRQLMRRVHTNREEARQRGTAARRRMVEQFSPEVVAQQVVAELRRINAQIPEIV